MRRHGRSLTDTAQRAVPEAEVEPVRGHAFSGTPRLLRGGNSKLYGIRRQVISIVKSQSLIVM